MNMPITDRPGLARRSLHRLCSASRWPVTPAP